MSKDAEKVVVVTVTKFGVELIIFCLEEQLIALNLTTLSYRRCRGMMIEMWKHFNVYESDVIAPSFKKGFSLRRKLDCHRFRANGIHKKTFYAAAAVAWNKLPLTVRSSKTMDTLKSRLDDH